MDLIGLHKNYETVLPLATRYCSALKDQIQELLIKDSISLGVPLEYRIKTWDSVMAKVERKSLNISSLRQLDDLVGIRIILLFKRDLAKTTEMISRNFVILSQEDTAQRLEEAQFGYQSLHYLIKLPEPWLSVPSLKEFGNFTAEVQVRTIAQHIWAAASHKLQYGKENSVPIAVRRSIHRVSALLETVDLEFDRVLQERELYVSEVNIDDSSEPLNVDLIAKLLDAHLPHENKDELEPYSDLLADLQHFNLRTAGQLRQLIQKHLKAALRVEEKEVQRRSEREDYYGTSKERNDRGVFYTHVGLTRNILHEEFGDDWKSYAKVNLTTNGDFGE